MAPLAPGIPTSFVPKQPVQTSKRKMRPGDNIFLLVSSVIAGVAIFAAAGVFAYDRYLAYVESAKSAELAKEEQAVNPDDVQAFVRLKNRLDNSMTILNNHVVLSQFFDELERVTLQSVSFSDLNIAVTTDQSAEINVSGTAKNFNALAAQSNALAADKLIKRSIISDITINPTGTVSFKLTADLDPKLVVIPAGAFPGALPSSVPLVPATTTATTTP